jgi:hypothetical protein
MSRHFGPIRQLGYVVGDIQAAMTYWTSVHGVGPFYLFAVAPVKELRYRDQATPAQMAIALGQSGPMQIELIQPLDEHPSLYRDFLLAHGGGLQHVAYWTQHFDTLVAQAQSMGMRAVLSGFTGDAAGRFRYFEGSVAFPGACLEISELSTAKRALFDEVARASVGWRGDDPIRSPGWR